MKKRILSIIITTIILMSMIGTNALAVTVPSSVINRDITVGKDQKWTYVAPISRTTKYSYFKASCTTVHPTGGTDNFEYIQATGKTMDGLVWGSIATIREGYGYYKITLSDGYLDQKYIAVYFRGNSPNYGAEATVSFYSE